MAETCDADALESALASDNRDNASNRAQTPSRSHAPKELLGRPKLTRLVGYALTDWAIIVLAWLGMWHTSAVFYPAWALLVAGRIHSFGVILHDVAHMPLRQKTPLVRLLELLCGYPLATTVDAMRYHHLRHHKDSGMPSDPYYKATVRGRPLAYVGMWLRGLALMPFWTVRGLYGSIAAHVPALQPSYARVFLQDRSGKSLSNHPEVRACAQAEHGQLAFHLGVAALATVWPEQVLFFFIIPGVTAGLLASYRLLVEHNYVPAKDRTVTTIFATTLDHSTRFFDQWLFGPRNIGFHIAHHLHPHVALEHLPKLAAWYREAYPDQYPDPYVRIRSKIPEKLV